MSELQRCHDKERWDEYVLEHGGHPLQLWGWGQVKASHGWRVERLLWVEDEQPLAAAQVLIRRLPLPFRAIAYVPRGPVVQTEQAAEFLEVVAAFIRREYKPVALSIEPHDRELTRPKGWVRSANRILSPETVLLDLTKGEGDLLATMAKKTRQYIRKSAAEGISLQSVRTPEDLSECLAIYRQTAQRASFNLHSDDYYHDIVTLLGDHSPIFAAYQDGRPIAFLWLAISAEVAYELYGGMNEAGQQLRANYALKWHAIRKMKEWGIKEYDFGGLVAGGVSVFKQGWAEEATEFVGTWDKPLSPLYGLWSQLFPRVKASLQKLRAVGRR